MKIFVQKETKAFEKRVALTPTVAKALVTAGYTIYIESGAGLSAAFADDDYTAAGATIQNAVNEVDVVLGVNAPNADAISQMKPHSAIISLAYAYGNKPMVEACMAAKVTLFSLDAVPRTTLAQKMDVLSSQANLAGYKAVILGANEMPKIFPMLMTAAGTIAPAKVLIFGAGVAGLQAIATAKRLGAVVEVTDVRPETKEQVESLGGKFLEVKTATENKIEGGYAKEVSAEFLQAQKELVAKHIAAADLVITTALVFGKKAPVLVTEAMVHSMKRGSVIIDMAVEQGGNCELSKMGETVVVNGVKIVGEPNLPALLALNASEMFAKNAQALLLHLTKAEGWNLNPDEEITKGCTIIFNGDLVHKTTRELLGM